VDPPLVVARDGQLKNRRTRALRRALVEEMEQRLLFSADAPVLIDPATASAGDEPHAPIELVVSDEASNAVSADAPALQADPAALPLAFEENQGQSDAQVAVLDARRGRDEDEGELDDEETRLAEILPGAKASAAAGAEAASQGPSDEASA